MTTEPHHQVATVEMRDEREESARANNVPQLFLLESRSKKFSQ